MPASGKRESSPEDGLPPADDVAIAAGGIGRLALLLGHPLTMGIVRALAVRVAGMASALLLYVVLARNLAGKIPAVWAAS